LLKELKMKNNKNFFERFWYLFTAIAVILIGLVAYLWLNNQALLKIKETTLKISPISNTENDQKQQDETDPMTIDLEMQGSSDQIEEIEYDLQTTDFTDIDKELDEIETEIGGEE